MSNFLSARKDFGGKLPAPLAILLGGFCVIALFYSLIIPLFEGPDEDDHFRYAKFIAEQRALPVQAFEPGGGSAGHQGWQPPLYYAFVALVIAPIDQSDYEQHLIRNYAATVLGDPACCGRNLYYHFGEGFPFTRTTLAVHLARLLSLACGALTVAATYALAEHLARALNFDDARRIFFALAVASVVAFNPSFLFASALVSNDAPLAACSALILLTWVRWLTGASTPTLKNAAWLGVWIGLGILCKTTALGLLPFSLLVVLIVAWRARAWRWAFASGAIMLGVIGALTGWWFARNQILYGDPLAYRLMTTSAIFPRAGELTPPELFQISLPWLWQTFWGGPTPADFAPTLGLALALCAGLALGGFTLFILRMADRQVRIALFALVAWLAFILVAQIQFIRTTTGADQGRYLFPAIPVIALILVLGLQHIAFYVLRFTFHVSRFAFHVSRFTQLSFTRLSFAHLSFVICSLIIGALLTLALFVPFAYTLPAYARPPLLSENDLARVARPLAITFADEIELRGYDLAPRAVQPGETLRVTLYWRARATMPEAYRVFVHLVGQNDQRAGGADVIPGRGAFPTLYWKPGDILRDVVTLPIDAHAAPGKYSVAVGLYPVGKPGERLTDEAGEDRIVLDAIKVAPRTAQTFSPRVRVGAIFGTQIELAGYDATPERLTLYWHARAPIADDYTVFAHWLDAQGNLIAQIDQQPQAGNYPTSFWAAGENIRDEYVPLAPPRAAQKIRIGVYRAETGERLHLPDGADYFEIAVNGTGQ